MKPHMKTPQKQFLDRVSKIFVHFFFVFVNFSEIMFMYFMGFFVVRIMYMGRNGVLPRIRQIF